MDEMQRSLGDAVVISESRVFDPSSVKVASYDAPVVADFSNVQYLEVSDPEADGEDNDDDSSEAPGSSVENTDGSQTDRTAPTTISTPAQKRKKEKRKNKKTAEAKEKEESSMFSKSEPCQ